MPNSTAAQKAATLIPMYAPIAALSLRIPVFFINSLYKKNPRYGNTNAILKQFAPNARIPPSPKRSACINSAMETDIHPAAGLPVKIAIRVPPTACPVVPPGSGTLNIIPKNEKAAHMPRSGIFDFGISVFILLMENPHTGSMAAVITAHVDGLK